MRTIHIRFKDRTKLWTRVVKDGRVFKQIISNDDTGQIILLNPILKRTLVGGVVIIDQWGSRDKWFGDNVSAIKKQW